MSQKNINYGTITAGGNVHIGDITYVLERDFPHSILFLRIDKGADGYDAMLSVKGPDDAPVPLLKQQVRLPVVADLFEQVDDFQSLRRGAGPAMRVKGLHRPSEQALESSLPAAIYQSFFAGDIGAVCTDFLELLQSAKIRDLLLVISTDDEAAQNLPWEMVLPLLNAGGGYALPRDNFGLVRSREKTVQRFNRQGPTASAAPIKLLFIPALPENLSERGKMLEIEDEQRKIIAAVSGLEATGTSQPKLVMEILDCANLVEITEALEKRSHDIVHISGHGAYIEALKEGILCMEDEDGNEHEVPGKALGQALRTFSSIKLLVLSACETAVGGSDGSTAEQLAAVGLRAVLAMRFSVTDAGARLFTETLYKRLAYGDALTKAMHDARLSLWADVQQRRANAPQVAIPAEWFTPVLYQNQVMGPLVTKGDYSTETFDRFYPTLDFIRGKHTRLIGEGFIGRKRLLIQLRQCFAQHRAVCLHGLGGLGKTTTAEAFAELYRKRYGHSVEIFRNGPNIQEAVILNRIFEKWKSRTKPDDFTAQNLLAQLEDPNPNTTIETKLDALIANCLKGQRTILIFDNFEDVQTATDGTQQQTIAADGLRAFLRYLLDNAPAGCQMLFTTRYRIADLTDLVTHLPVDKMTYAEQYRYLNFSDTLRRLPPAERTIVDRRIDGHPRALEFLEGLLRKDRRFALTDFDKTVGQVETDIFANLLLARLLTQLSETETTVFLTASVFFSRTPVAALSAVLNTPADELAPVLTALRNWSLCFWDEATQTVEVHALTRAWLRTQNQPDPNAFTTISQQTGAYFRDQPTWDDEVLAMDYFEQAESWDDYATAAFRLTSHYRTIGLYPTAKVLNEQVLAKDISPKINARASNGLGMSAFNIGDYETALTYLQQSLRIQQEIGDRSGEGTTLNNISQIYDARGDYETALTHLQQSLRIRQEIGDKIGKGTTLHNIGTLHFEQFEDVEQAISLLWSAYTIFQQIGSPMAETSKKYLDSIERRIGKKKFEEILQSVRNKPAIDNP